MPPPPAERKVENGLASRTFDTQWNSPSAGQGCQRNGERVQHVCHGVLRPVYYTQIQYILHTHNYYYLSPCCGVCACALYYFVERVCACEFLRVKTAADGVLCYRTILRPSRSHQSIRSRRFDYSRLLVVRCFSFTKWRFSLPRDVTSSAFSEIRARTPTPHQTVRPPSVRRAFTTVPSVLHAR